MKFAVISMDLLMILSAPMMSTHAAYFIAGNSKPLVPKKGLFGFNRCKLLGGVMFLIAIASTRYRLWSSPVVVLD
jgi:hypothetical protein